MADTAVPAELTLTNRPVTRRAWWTTLADHREVLVALARKDFQTRYKRASFGVLWAVAVPALQGAVMAFVFSRVVRVFPGVNFGAYVMSGILAWSFFGTSLMSGTTAIVDGSGLTDKVWFPRVLLVVVPPLANIVGLAVSMLVLVVALPIFGVGLHAHTLWLIPACMLLVAFTIAFCLVASALHVYFRDTKFIVQAALVVWLYVTPIVYQKPLLGRWAGWLDANPMTGVITLFHMAAFGSSQLDGRPIVVALAVTAVLAIVGTEVQRRHDRLFVDRL